MTKKRDTDLKSENRTNFEQKGPSQVSRASVENRDILPEDAPSSSNPVSRDMAKSRNEAIRTNDRK